MWFCGRIDTLKEIKKVIIVDELLSIYNPDPEASGEESS